MKKFIAILLLIGCGGNKTNLNKTEDLELTMEKCIEKSKPILNKIHSENDTNTLNESDIIGKENTVEKITVELDSFLKEVKALENKTSKNSPDNESLKKSVDHYCKLVDLYDELVFN